MCKVHFIGGDTLDVYLDYETLKESLEKNSGSQYIIFNDMAIRTSSITYIEKYEVEA